MAGLSTPLEMIDHRTLDPREGYKYYAKAKEEFHLFRKVAIRPGWLGTGSVILAADFLTGSTLARGGLSNGHGIPRAEGWTCIALTSASCGAGMPG